MTGDEVLAAVESAVREWYGHTPVRASVSFVGVQPIEVLRFEPAPEQLAYLTLGMSRHPMTAASEIMQDSTGPRAELLLNVRRADPAYEDAWRQLAVLAAAPAVEGVVYTSGMTVDLGRPVAGASRCTGVVITASELAAVPVGEDVTQILQVVPATSTELAFSRIHGVSAVQERWTEQHTDLLDLARGAVRLD